MSEHHKIETVPLSSLPDRIQNAYDDYFSFVAGVDEEHPIDGVSFIWKRPGASTVDLSEYFLLKESEGWHFEVVHPDVADAYMLDKMESGCVVKIII